MSYIQRQHHLGLAGLALLRSWLVKKDSDVKDILLNMYRMLDVLAKSKFVNDDPKAKEFTAIGGYEKWAETYDGPNMLLDIEEPVVRNILKKIPSGKALDAGCGTGRYSLILKSLGHDVTGLDQSPEMLEKARQKNKSVTFVEGKINSLPFVNDSFDLAVCALALTHFKELDKPIAELSRVVQKQGYLLISDINPWFVALGAHADFHDKNGEWGYVENFVHWHSEYLKVFKKHNLEVLDCIEPVVESKNLTISEPDNVLNKKVLDLAMKDLPMAVIWLLKKK